MRRLLKLFTFSMLPVLVIGSYFLSSVIQQSAVFSSKGKSFLTSSQIQDCLQHTQQLEMMFKNDLFLPALINFKQTHSQQTQPCFYQSASFQALVDQSILKSQQQIAWASHMQERFANPTPLIMAPPLLLSFASNYKSKNNNIVLPPADRFEEGTPHSLEESIEIQAPQSIVEPIATPQIPISNSKTTTANPDKGSTQNTAPPGTLFNNLNSQHTERLF